MLGSAVYADDEAFAAHRDGDAMAAVTPVLGALIAESEVIIGEPRVRQGCRPVRRDL
jgi:(4S)-4-hydroxy-5-phosphonooxypentane-2,3-dione isomerase